MSQEYGTTNENYQPDGKLELPEDFSDAEFASLDITTFNLATLFQEAEQVARDFTPFELDQALLVA